MIYSTKTYKNKFSVVISILKSKIVFVLFLYGVIIISCRSNESNESDYLLPDNRNLKSLKINDASIQRSGDTIYLNNVLLDGDIQFQFEDGTVMYNTTYENGLKNGRYLEYFFTGELKIHTYYLNDNVDGWYKSFHPDGKISENYFQKEGKKIGIHKRWYPDGQLMSIAHYENGEVIKEIQYDFRNNIVKNVILKDGRVYGKPRAKYCTD